MSFDYGLLLISQLSSAAEARSARQFRYGLLLVSELVFAEQPTYASQIISRLDAALARRGEDIMLRASNTAVSQVTVKGRRRFYRPDEIEGIIIQGDSKVVISPTGLDVFGIPPSNGYVVIAGTPRRIIAVNAIRDGGTLVRIDMQVRGIS